MVKLIWLVPLLPLIGFVIIGLLNKRLSKGITGVIASGAVLGSFAISLMIFLEFVNNKDLQPQTISLFEWISAGNLKIPFSFLVDQLSSLFLMIITGVGFLIHVYSVGYMHDDEGFQRFFAYLNLFVFFMLVLVLGSNYLIMFVGWEGVGLCSYLLIGFWFKNTDYNNAAKKAFIMNRVGDLGFLLGIILIYITFGSTSFADVFPAADASSTNRPELVAIGLLLFIGAMGKSAQIPLYTWLPDAMAGPTPVSALIHAATMVTAGIYMIARSNLIYTNAPDAMYFVAVIGAITALFAASIGLVQNDIKKVLAYSTVSQLGLMFLALGVGAYTTAVFHVMTHAFFKALLFLGAGSVIHAMSGEQDIRRMGGLKKHLPVTYWTFLIGTIAISGIPPFAGFFSKDEILAYAYDEGKFFWFMGMLTSLFTAFYMFRLFFLTFHGDFRGTEKQLHHLHESPKSMTIPLVVLAVLSVIGGFVGLPAVFSDSHWLNSFLGRNGVVEKGTLTLTHSEEYMLMTAAVIAAAAMLFAAYFMYVKKKQVPAEDDEEVNPVYRTVYNKYYVDEIYNAVITKPLNFLSALAYRFFELGFVDGIVNGIGTGVQWTSKVVRYVQTGNIGFYIFAMVAGIVLIFALRML
jgi:NADH-quinone oxidoreductase subunit L